MDGASDESHSTGAQIHPTLRQRMINRTTTFAEGSQPPKILTTRRRSSMLSDFSETRQSLRSSSENLLRESGRSDSSKVALTDKPSHWTSLPILAAIVPAAVGLKYENGAAIATDLLLLGLAAWFLNWCVRVPWDWYYEAQQRQYEYDSDEDISFDSDIIIEEDEAGADSLAEHTDNAADDSQDAKLRDQIQSPCASDKQEQAQATLRREELLAFIYCFLGPVFGATLLYALRDHLTCAEGIVSSFNLIIFLLGAEIRPCRRLIEMKRKKILHIQRIVQVTSGQRMRALDARQLSERLEEVEARLERPVTNVEPSVVQAGTDVRMQMQKQVDDLIRAVRKYEKKTMAQTIQNEARFKELDTRLRDALSLAAAAARTGQQPGIIYMMTSWIVEVVNFVLSTIWTVVIYPWRTLSSSIATIQSWFIKAERQPRKRNKSQVNGHSSISTARMQAKTGR